MAAGDPGSLKRTFSATAIETTLVNSVASAASGDTTTSVAVVSVSGFPISSPFVPFTLILDADGSKEEVVTVTAATSTTLTLTRGQDGTTAFSHAAGTSVRHGVSARDFKEEQTHQAARGYDNDTAILASAGLSHIHGLASGDGNIVGSTQSVTLTRKTLTTPTINGATLTGSVTSTAAIDMTSGTITGLVSTGMVSSSATPKSYVDAILGSATAASTSATSAATSATSAATSATSAAASATASANSANAAATSASSALTSQTAAATSATSAAASATAAATSASSAATSATASASSASAAATSASSAATSASSAATSATTAQNWATQLVTPVSGTDYSAKYNANFAATSATSAATSATSAAASATAAATSATSAAASATAAATSASSALTSQSAAATSATSAATSASSALTSQTAAATSATSAAASATAAATSATSAATSATSAATTYTNYDQRYLGSKASAPTVDNQGGALITGATYWNSTAGVMYVWSGSAWSAISTANGAVTTGTLAQFAATTSAQLAGVISDETGTGALVFGTSPTLTTAVASADPTTALGLATKQYVDLVTAGVNYHAPVVAASVSNLSANYSNGTSGVGATLTADTNRAFSTLDGQTVSVGQRILIKDQTTQLQNGIYTLTTVGSGAAPWVITRATDNDQTPEIANGDVINVTGGTVNSGKTFVNSSASSITIGTTAITFASYYTGLPSQTGSAGNYLTTDGTTPSWSAITAGSQVKIDSGSGTTYTYIDFLGMGTDTGTAGTVKVQPLTNTGSNTGKRIYSGSTTPSSPITGDVWIDITGTTDPDLRTMDIMGAY